MTATKEKVFTKKTKVILTKCNGFNLSKPIPGEIIGYLNWVKEPCPVFRAMKPGPFHGGNGYNIELFRGCKLKADRIWFINSGFEEFELVK